ncbi:MAG: serine O-acetyltransferase EpsC, partial [Pseudomonadota bacterium]|nr:serine O-acetyltransferase EpsC [Pseudomonadota bacterium]
SVEEVILTYPGFEAITVHRVAHWLWCNQVPFLPRVIAEHAHTQTGIDIHPGATIGRNFFIDHGFTVIGETAVIGNNVTIYQNVTLGGTNPTNGIGGKRHPTIMDNVIIGSGAQVIGPIVVGERARIGANAVVTDDVPEGATMIGFKARSTLVPVETYMREFMPYGTPCNEQSEPDMRRFEAMEQQLTEMRAELEALRRSAASNTADIADAQRSGSNT